MYFFMRGPFGREQAEFATTLGGILSVTLVPQDDVWRIQVRLHGYGTTGMVDRIYTKAQTTQERTFRNLDTAYREIRRWWSGTITVATPAPISTLNADDTT